MDEWFVGRKSYLRPVKTTKSSWRYSFIKNFQIKMVFGVPNVLRGNVESKYILSPKLKT